MGGLILFLWIKLICVVPDVFLLSGLNLLDLPKGPDLLFPLFLLHILLLIHPYGDSFLSTLLFATILDWTIFLVFSPSSTLPSFLHMFLLI
jgi:hypothetical protein